MLPGLSLLLLSPTLFILTIHSIAFRRFGMQRTCPRRTLSLSNYQMKIVLNHAQSSQKVWLESIKCVSEPPIDFTNLLSNSLLIKIPPPKKGHHHANFFIIFVINQLDIQKTWF
ncbi:hypothetical protein [Salmonella bongori]|uniref:hypothetical protein n=1 Tax=Salmonella bongori TaxID=54736 RepID=UPI0015C53AE5|nr:hypothetical protein [Salmonella bongori]